MSDWNLFVSRRKLRFQIGDDAADVHLIERRKETGPREYTRELLLRKWWEGRERPRFVAYSFAAGTAILHFRHTCFGLSNLGHPVILGSDHPFFVHAATITEAVGRKNFAMPFSTLACMVRDQGVREIATEINAVKEFVPSVREQSIGISNGRSSRTVVYLHFRSDTDRVAGRMILTGWDAKAMENIATE